MNTDGRSFVDKLAAYLEAHPEETPAGLAVRAGLDNSVIRNLLNGRSRAPRLETAMRICAALGTTLEEFMGEARTPVERDILRLLGQLPAAERAQLLGYGEALARAAARGSEDREEEQG